MVQSSILILIIPPEWKQKKKAGSHNFFSAFIINSMKH